MLLHHFFFLVNNYLNRLRRQTIYSSQSLKEKYGLNILLELGSETSSLSVIDDEFYAVSVQRASVASLEL